MTNIIYELVRAIVLKNDRTVIDFGAQAAGGLADKIQASKLLQKKSNAKESVCNTLLQSGYDAYFLEQECLSTALVLLEALSASKVFNFLPNQTRSSLHTLIFFRIMALPCLKLQQSLDMETTVIAIIKIATNMLQNTNNNHFDRSLQTELLHAFTSFKHNLLSSGSCLLNSKGWQKVREHLTSLSLPLALSSSFAPLKADKYAPTTNTLAWLQSSQRQLFV